MTTVNKSKSYILLSSDHDSDFIMTPTATTCNKCVPEQTESQKRNINGSIPIWPSGRFPGNRSHDCFLTWCCSRSQFKPACVSRTRKSSAAFFRSSGGAAVGPDNNTTMPSVARPESDGSASAVCSEPSSVPPGRWTETKNRPTRRLRTLRGCIKAAGFGGDATRSSALEIERLELHS